MKFVLPAPPRSGPVSSHESVCKRNAWIANAGWRLRLQLAKRARCGRKTVSETPVVVAIAAPEGCVLELYAAARPIIELLCRHDVIAAKQLIRGLSLVWHDGDDIAVTLEPTPLQGAG